MNNSIKITIILGIVTSFFPVYPMSEEREMFFVIKTKDLKNLNPIENMSELPFKCPGEQPAYIFSEKSQSRTPEIDLLLADRALTLSLAAIKICNESNKKKNAETLETIRKAIGEGIPITSQYSIRNITPQDAIKYDILSSGSSTKEIVVSGDNPAPCPLLKKIVISANNDYFLQKKDLIPDTPVLAQIKKCINELCRNKVHKHSTHTAIFSAIFQGERDRKKRLSDICDKLKIECLPEFNDKEREKLFAEAEQKFHEEQQS